MDFRRKCAALLLLYHIGAALEIFVPPTYQVREGSPALIPCKYTVGSHPVDPTRFAAFWYFQGKQILSYDDQVRAIDPRFSLDTEKALNGIVDLSISKITISDGGVYTCSVLYSPIQKKEDITVDVEAPPQLLITNSVVGVNEESVLRCSITGFYPEDITVTWFRGTEILGTGTMDGPRSNSDGTFSVDSSVTITPTEEDRERNFSCRVQHKSLKQPLQTDFKLIYKAPPQLLITNSVVGVNEESVLRCSITGFYPEDITVTWFRGTEILGKGTMDGPRSNSDGTFSVDSTVTITPTEEDREQNFSCKVQHKSLKQPLQTDFRLIYRDTQSSNPTLSTIHIVAIVAGVILVFIIIPVVLVYCRRKRRPSVPQNNENTLKLLNDPVEPMAGRRDILPETGPSVPQNNENTLEALNNPVEPMTTLPETGPTVPQNNENTIEALNDHVEPMATLPETGPTVPQNNENTIEPLKDPAVPMATLPDTGSLSDLMMEEIKVPELTVNKQDTLTCTIHNYINGVHTVKWYEEKENERTAVLYDPRKQITIERDPESDKPNTYRSCLALQPVTEKDDGIKYICRVEGSNSEWKEKCTGCLQVTGILKSPEKKMIPENQIKASYQGGTPKKVTLEGKNAEEPRLESSVNELTNSKGNLELPEQIPKPLAEQEADLQGEYDDHENPQKGWHPAKELSGEEGTEEHSQSTEPLDKKEIDTSGVRSTREDEEEVNQEKEGNEEPSGPINTSFTEEEPESEEHLCSAEESPDDHDNEETSLLSNKMKLDNGLKESSTEIVMKNSDVFSANRSSDDDGDNDDDDENKPLNNV